MKTTEDRPNRIDYGDIARRYNELEKGCALRIPRVYNITHFRAALERRGLLHRADFKASVKGRQCIIKKLSDARMNGGEEA